MDPAEESSGPSKSKQPIVGRLGVLQPAISPEHEHAGAGVASAARKLARTGLEDGEKGISLSKLPKKRGGLPKRDRSTLRKGKWTLEEEEYTSRIIHYFSTGLLTLPEGSTLRSYLAEKLNCDPMRITKKYAGAACLGRRAYHYSERAQPTIAEIQLAKAQLDELEHRFRVRVEEGYSSAPLPSPSELILSSLTQHQQAQMLLANQTNPAATLQSWLLGLSVGAAAQGSAVLPVHQPVAAPAPWNISSAAPAPQVGQAQWLLPNVAASSVPVANPAPAQPQGIDFSSLSRLALNSQGGSALAPILSQLAAAQSLQQQSVQQPVAQAAEPKPAPATMAYQQPQQQQVVASNQDQINAYANELKKAYELQIASLAPPASSVPAMGATVQPQQHLPPQKQQQQQQKQQQPIPFQIQAAASALSARSLSARTDVELNTSLQGQNDTNTFAKPRTDEDKAAGSILLGFLSSLRQSYLEAVREKSKMDCMNGASLSQTGEGNEDESPDQSRAPAVTDSSGSQPAVDSSLDDSDWNSDKKTDPSSSEDSDKEGTERPVKKRGQSSTTSASDIGVMRLSRGPPRKRLKTKKLPRKQARRLSR